MPLRRLSQRSGFNVDVSVCVFSVQTKPIELNVYVEVGASGLIVFPFLVFVKIRLVLE